MDTIKNQRIKVYNNSGWIKMDTEGNLDGVVDTPYGYVRVWATVAWTSQYTGQRYPTRAGLTFIWQGMEYCRWITRDHKEREFTKRGLTTMAGRFAKSIAGQTSARDVEVSCGR